MNRTHSGASLVIAALATPRGHAIQLAPFTAVRVDGAFWTPHIETNRQTTARSWLKKCEETGRIGNLPKAGGIEPGKFQGYPFDDSGMFQAEAGHVASLT